jgi:hypothetical protein
MSKHKPKPSKATGCKKKPKVPVPSKKELAEYFAIEEQRLEHSRQASDIRRLQTATEIKVLDYVREAGGPQRCAILHGYRLSIELSNERVEWKTELLQALAKEVGKTKAAKIAARIIKAAGTKEVAQIEPPITPSGTGTKPPPVRVHQPAPGHLF